MGDVPGPQAAGSGKGRGRYLVALGLGILVAIGWIVISTTTYPLRETCDPALSAGACSETIVAALKKGMPRPHPLLLAAHAAPGPEAGNDQLGHRATVTFDAAGMPGPITVDLYVDMGAHWGGVVDPGAGEVEAWVAIQGVLAAAVVTALAGWAIRRRRRREGRTTA